MPPKKKPYNQLSESAKFFRNNPKARKRKNAISKKVNARPEQRKKRVELQAKRRASKKRGVDTSKSDYDHSVGRRVSIKKNRGRRGEGGRKKRKRK